MRTRAIPTEHVACILTYVTASGRRCFYATKLPDDDDCGEKCQNFALPPGIDAQLRALEGRLAWRYLATPRPMATRGPAAGDARMVTEAPDGEFGRLVFL